MHINDFIRNFERKKIVEQINEGLEPNERHIILPIKFHDATIEMCNKQREVQGVLLCLELAESKNLWVQSMINIGYGTNFSVFA